MGIVVLSELAENPFFPPEDRGETPRSSKKRPSTGTPADHSSKKSKSTRDPKETGSSSKERDHTSKKPRSPDKGSSRQTPAPGMLHTKEPSSQHRPASPTPDFPQLSTVPFVHPDTEATWSPHCESPSPVLHSAGEEPLDNDLSDMFYDSETDCYYMSVSRELAFQKFTAKLNLRPVASDRGKPSALASKPPAPTTQQSVVQPSIPLREPDQATLLDYDSEPEVLPPSEDPSEEDTSLQGSPQRMHHPEPSSPTDDVHSFNEHIIKMARALDIELSYPEEEARDPIERRVHGCMPTPPSIPLFPSLKTIVKRSWDAPASLVGSSHKIKSLYRISPSCCSWLADHPKQNSAIVEGAQQTFIPKQATSPADQEAKKIDGLARKAYSAAALAV
ncbi:histone-lysine N-methyltransferase SETD1B-like [Sceloporus undulatus]|uniref:histone-lysine N-methyltransferase SETD1B-like n=1 Tax=Sceloporus undulatus TaxID=8520 RepID=UPI001C4D2D47|nr:histone-lysine N-methyltransferase SETD1B-like [Sceloporus undulatus]